MDIFLLDISTCVCVSLFIHFHLVTVLPDLKTKLNHLDLDLLNVLSKFVPSGSADIMYILKLQ